MVRRRGSIHTLSLSAVDGLAEARSLAMSTRAAVDVRRWDAAHSTGFNVAEITPAALATDEVIVYPMSFDYRIEPLVLRRLEVISTVTARRAVLVETPGITMRFDDPASTPRSAVPAAAWTAAVVGNFAPLAALQWRAITETVAAAGDAPLRFVGESLGAQSVMSMTRAVTPLSVDLIEPTNCRPQSLREMLRVGRALVRVEEPLRAAYAAQTIARGWNAPTIFETASSENLAADRRLKRFWTQGRWAAASALAMSRGLTRELGNLHPPTPVRVWRAAQSMACDLEVSSAFIDDAAERTGDAELITLGIDGAPAGHHLLTDLDAATGFSLELRRRWDAQKRDGAAAGA